ncbi:MAG: type IX secretion system protein PorQ [Saprospiraceae bacterium]|nr:type IX secretion system protein PorQ [Saprospiraceae bacterium]
MKKHLTNLLVFSALAFNAHAQIVGGNNAFEFLGLPASARLTGLGGHQITVQDDDVAFALSNPATLNPQMHGQLSFNHNFMVSDIGGGYFGYGHHLKKSDITLHAGVQYLNYGQFDATDVTGTVIGDFKAKEQAFTIGAGRKLYERVSVGANLRYISSQFETYNADGLALDLGALFHDTVRQVSVALVLKNIGSQMQTYTGSDREPLPYEAQLGISKRLKHLPFRMTAIYRYLNRWNIRYDDPNSQEDTFLFGEDSANSDHPVRDNLLRHFVFNGEFLLGKKENFRMRIGYNHLMHKETEVRNLRSMSGFAFGFGFKVKWFRVDFGRSVQHLGAGNTHFSISTNFKK